MPEQLTVPPPLGDKSRAAAQKMELDKAAWEREQARKDELHRLKVQQADNSAAQKSVREAATTQAVLRDKEIPPPPQRAHSAPSTGREAPVMVVPVPPMPAPAVPGSTDTVPAMLTPGEAVIPAPAAQNPANKPIIAALVQEGRTKNALQIPSDAEMEKMSFEDLWLLRNRIPRDSPDQKRVAPYEHRAFTRQTVQDQPLTAPLGHMITIPGYQLYKALGMGNSRTGPSLEQAKQAYKGVWDGMKSNMGFEDGTTGVPEVPVKTEVQMAQAVKFTPEEMVRDTPENIRKRDEADIQALQEELRRQKLPEARAVLQAELDDKLKRVGRSSVIPALPLSFVPPPEPTPSITGLVPVPTLGGLDPNPSATFEEMSAAPVPLLSTNPVDQAARVRPQAVREMRARREDPSQKLMTATEELTWINNRVKELVAQLPKEKTPEKQKMLEPTPEEMNVLGDYVKGLPINEQEPAKVPPVGASATTSSSARSTATTLAEKTADYEKRVEEILKTPMTRNPMYELQKTVRETTEATGKPPTRSWLAERLADIWGPTGLFREQDLARFALVAAGGMLFGGSTKGSLRYAARDSLQQADQRATKEAAQRAQMENEKRAEARQNARDDMAKTQSWRLDLQARTRNQEDKFIELKRRATATGGTWKMGKTAVSMDAVLEKANELYQKGRVSTDPVDKEMHYNAAVNMLAEAQAAADAHVVEMAALKDSASPKPLGEVLNYDTFRNPMNGESMNVLRVKEDGRFVVPTPDGYRLLPSDFKNTWMTDKEYGEKIEDLRKMTRSGILSAVRSHPQVLADKKKWDTATIESKANFLADQARNIFGNFGMLGLRNERENSQLINSAVKAIIENQDDLDTIDTGALAQILQTGAMVRRSSSQGHKILTLPNKAATAGSGARKSIGVEAYAALEQGVLAETKQPYIVPEMRRVNRTPEAVALEALQTQFEKWQNQNEGKNRQTVEMFESQPLAQKQGWNGFTWWLRNNKTFPSPGSSR
jgi:hypothetical protein